MTDEEDGEVPDMGAAENAELIRRGYEAFNAGDLAALGELFAEDAVWYAPGSGVLSGTKQGRDAIFAYFGELGARSQGTFQATVQDIVGGENHTVGIHQSHAESNGKTLDLATAIAFVLRDGKVIEGREYFDDTAKADEFWA
ncbi:nuclear transport factor 2 family protein [Paeniglutamicibacter kerguelensis]|uniref:Ketosteroid isomerase-like protein n=1 Tax=Paeniglutamicibacter kerguelensis TaxID=254788 RepID=A0ABS4XB34_9MICC|nr:nuclear transport factor 2 family protein [Paeniglutamicibacter kerguelensis]MBP2385680.1 ketosteroid isomerase-like protein [Paeniglutamicibacter kerguelensis]